MSRSGPRVQLTASGSFASIADAFPALDEGLKHVIKLEFAARPSDPTKSPQPNVDFATDRLLLDLGAIDPTRFDPNIIVRDCEIVRQVALEHPEMLHRLVSFFQSGLVRDVKTILQMQADLETIGLTEDAALRAGGGLIWVVVAVGAALLVGGCATTSQGGKFPPINHPLGQSSPGPSTQPGSGPSTQPRSGPSSQPSSNPVSQ
jgi:hypothetical protein